jgi:outer membrane lipoprotein-sorting protein
MKNILLILFLIIICISLLFLSGCGKDKRDPNVVTTYLKNLDSYTSDVKMNIKNDKQEIIHNIKQFYSKDKGYALILNSSRVMIYKDNKIYVKDLKNNSVYSQNEEFDVFYKFSFVNEYVKMLYTNEEIKYSYEQIDGEENQLMHFIIPGTNRNFNKAVLYVNIKNNLPEKVIIYDNNGEESVEITYDNFRTDEQYDESIFDV